MLSLARSSPDRAPDLESGFPAACGMVVSRTEIGRLLGQVLVKNLGGDKEVYF